MPIASPSSPSLSLKVGRSLLGCSLLAIVAFSLLDLSATRVFRTPWWLPMMVVQLLPIFVLAVFAGVGALTNSNAEISTRASSKLARSSRIEASLNVTGIGIGVMWIGGIVSALVSPHRDEALINLTGLLAMLSTGVSCGVLLAPQSAGFSERLARVRNLIGLVFVFLIVDSLASWTIQDVIPGLSRGAALTKEFGEDAWRFSWDNFRNLRPFGHSNYTAGAAVLMIPWLAILAWETRGKNRAGWVIATVMAGVLLFSSGSRGGLLGLAGAMGIGALLALWQGGRRLRVIAVFALLTGAVLALANPRMRETLIGITRTERVPSGSDLERRSMLRAGLRMGSDRWLTGWGAGTTPLVFPAYRGQLGVSLENSFQLHNQAVTFWAEGGLFVILGTGVLLSGLGLSARAALLRSWTGPRILRSTAIAAVLSMSGYIFVLCTDSQLDVVFFGATVGVLSAVIWACGRAVDAADREAGVPLSSSPSLSASEITETSTVTTAPLSRVTTKRIQLFTRIAIAGCVLASLGIVVKATVPKARLRAQLASAFEELDLERGDLFVESLREIAREFPNDFIVANLRAWADPRVAREQWERSLAINPIQELPHSNLGWLLVDKEPAVALAHFKAAAALVPDKGGTYFGQTLALAAIKGGGRSGDQGLAMTVQECLRNPSFAFSPFVQKMNDGKLRSPTFTKLRIELGKISVDKARAAWVHAEAEDYLTLLDWWDQKNTPQEIRDRFHSATRRAYFDAFMHPAGPLSEAAGPAAWQLMARAQQNLATDGLPADSNIRDLRAAYVRLAGTEPPTPKLFALALTGWPLNPVTNVTFVPHAVRYSRPGYAILMRNTDLPTMNDLYNAMRVDWLFFIEGLLPRKGWCLPMDTETVALPESSSRP